MGKGSINVKRFQLILVVFVTLLSGCKADGEDLPYLTSFMQSGVEGKYYITILGATDEQAREFQLVFNQNIEIITGYYENGEPTERELRALKVASLPTYIIFNRDSEVFRTDHIIDLKKFLSEKTKDR